MDFLKDLLGHNRIYMDMLIGYLFFNSYLDSQKNILLYPDLSVTDYY